MFSLDICILLGNRKNVDKVCQDIFQIDLYIFVLLSPISSSLIRLQTKRGREKGEKESESRLQLSIQYRSKFSNWLLKGLNLESLKSN